MSNVFLINGVTDVDQLINTGLDAVVTHASNLSTDVKPAQLPIFPVTVFLNGVGTISCEVGYNRIKPDHQYIGEMLFGAKGSDLTNRASFVLLSVNVNTPHTHNTSDVTGLEVYVQNMLNNNLPEDLQGLIGLPGTTGFIKKLGPGDYAIDSTPYVTTSMLDDVVSTVEGELAASQATVSNQLAAIQTDIDDQIIAVETSVAAETSELRTLLNNIPYDISTMIIGRPAANAVVLSFHVVNPFTTAADVEFGKFTVEKAATNDVFFTVYQNEAQIGTIHFAPEAQVATLTVESTQWLPGDILMIKNGPSQDGTLSTVSLTIKGITSWLSG